MKLNEISGGQKVWAVYHREPYDSTDLFGIFSTEAYAKKAIKNLVDKEHVDESHYEIQEIIVNKIYSSAELLN